MAEGIAVYNRLVTSLKTLNLTNSTIENNIAEYGGAIINEGTAAAASTTIINSTIFGNTASAKGGAIHNNQGSSATSLEIINSTISGNSANSGGSGINSENSTLIINNSIITGNLVTDDISNTGSTITDNGYNIIGASSGYTWSGTGDWNQQGTSDTYNKVDGGSGTLNLSSSLEDNGGDTKTLAITSPSSIAVGNGYYDASVTTTDQRGATRHSNPTIGAYEFYADYRTDSGTDTLWSDEDNWDIYNGIGWDTATDDPDADNSTSIAVNRSMNVDASVSIDETTVASAVTLTVNNGITLTVANGTGTDLTVNGTLTNAGSGTISCTDDSLVDYALTTGDQNIFAATYYNLQISGGSSRVKSLTGLTNISNNLTVAVSTELAVGAQTLNLTNASGTTDINGTLTISTGTVDADGTFDASGGAVTFTGAGTLELGGATITSLGDTFTKSTGTVEYNYAGSQNVIDVNYYNLTVSGSGTKTLKGDLESGNRINTLTVDADSTTAVFDTDGYDVYATVLTVASDGSITDSGTAGRKTVLYISTTSNIGGNITTLETQTYTGAVTLTTDNVEFTTTNKNITFGSTIAGETSARNLTINSGTGTTTLTGAVITNIGTIDIDAGTLTQNAAITATGQVDIDVTNSLIIDENLTSGGATNITVTGDNNSFTLTSGDILSSTLDNLTISADDMDISGMIIAATETVTLKSSSIGDAINLGTNGDVADTLELNDTELDKIAASTLIIGDSSNAGAVTVSAGISPANITNLHLKTNSTITGTAGGIIVTNLALTAGGAINISDDSTNVTKLAVSNSGK